MRRTYGQFCALARALDIVGERWTLLLVRELSGGPKRYTDLLSNLAGIGTSLLAHRLQTMEEHGIVRRRVLPPPAASTVYELTDVGAELVDAMLPLVIWGARHTLNERQPADDFRAEWPLLIVRAMAAPDPSISDTYEFRIDETVAHIVADHGSLAVRAGPADNPDAVITTDADTLVAVGVGRLDPGEAITDGRMHIDGAEPALKRLAATIRPFADTP